MAQYASKVLDGRMNVLNVWLGLPASKKIISLISVVATIAALVLITKMAIKPKMDLLYAGLEPAAAGEIVAKLEAAGVPYEVKGQSIYADARRRDALRLELAREGLPRQSTVGYELFDDMNSFAMTSEMFDTAYWRAKEGELARTILAMPAITGARVHLGAGKAQGFSRAPQVSSASVTVNAPGGLSDQQIKALQYLTALAVSGLSPEKVAIIDTQRGVVAGPGIGAGGGQNLSDDIDRAAKIKEKILSLLEARVGAGNARVSVSLDVNHTHETTAERRFDPDGRVMKSQTSSDLSSNSSGTSANVTVASNLPEGQAGGGGQNSSDRSETTETVTYEVSEVVRNTEILPGEIKRMTVAILINDVPDIAEDGTVSMVPRPDVEITALRDLAASAAGLDTERGDQLTIKSFPFELPEPVEPVEKPGMVDEFLDIYMGNMVMAAILGVIILLLGLFVVRPMFRASAPAPANEPGLLPMSLETGGSGMMIEGPGDVRRLTDGSASSVMESAEPKDPIELLKAKTAEQEEDAASILAEWLEQDKAATS